MGAVMIAVVPGEEELGEQQRCSRCGEWYPADPEFYYRDRYRKAGLMSYCKACWEGIRRATDEQIEAYRAAARAYRRRQSEEQRERNRERNRNYRARQRYDGARSATAG